MILCCCYANIVKSKRERKTAHIIYVVQHCAYVHGRERFQYIQKTK